MAVRTLLRLPHILKFSAQTGPASSWIETLRYTLEAAVTPRTGWATAVAKLAELP
jgi:hypothetical protein